MTIDTSTDSAQPLATTPRAMWALGDYALPYYPEPWEDRPNAYPPGPAYARGVLADLFYPGALH